MTTRIKLASFMLAALMILSLLISCETKNNADASSTQQTEVNESTEILLETDSKTSTETETVTETEAPEFHPTIEKTNYNDTCFMHVFEHLKYLYVEESEGDTMTEAMFARQQKLYDYLGVELMGVQTGNLETYGAAFKNAVKNKDGSVDVMICSAYVDVAPFISEGYLRKYNNLPAIDLDADYWKTDYMSTLQFNDDIYLGYSDFMIFNIHVISFNKDMMAQYEDALPESVYDSVRNYHWTIDKMISLANLVYIDKTSDGKTEDDVFGITGRQWIPFIGFLHACDINLVEQNDAGEFLVSVFNEKNNVKTSGLVDKMLALSKSNNAYFRFRIEETKEIKLHENQSLMTVQGTDYLVDNLNYDISFGVLPYPMYDEAQKSVGYRSFNYDGYITFPSFMRNENMSVETMEMLSFFSAPVEVAFYEKLLGKKVADVPDDRQMLEIVWNGICTDFGLAFSRIDATLGTNLYMLPTVTHANATDNVASFVKSYEKAANSAIRSYIKKMEKLSSKYQ